MRIRKTTCHACGGIKQQASATAYVYCDYCGTLADWDFQTACRTAGSMLPGPAYKALCAEVEPLTAEARAKGDRNAFLAHQRRLFETYAKACRASCPPRIGDPAYRARYVEHQAAFATVCAFDEVHEEIGTRLDAAIAALHWTGLPAPRVASKGFWRMAELVEAQMERRFLVAEQAGIQALDPDQSPSEMGRRMGWSIFCQGWLPYLDKEAAKQLLDRSGLGESFIELPERNFESRNCGHCGGNLELVPGARVVVCEGCGYRLDAAVPEFPCGGCGGRMTFPVDTIRTACPFCKAELVKAAGLA